MEYNGEGFINIILGCMFSYKTSELLKQYRKYKKLGKKCIIIKYLNDTRYSKTGIATHDLIVQKEDVINCSGHLNSIMDAVINYEIILIDEGQFFDDLVEFADTLANKKKGIIVVGLDGTFDRKPFGHILELIPKAEKVKKLAGECGICKKRKAYFSKLKKTIVGAKSGDIIIGGDDKYEAVCRICFNDLSQLK